MSVNQETFFNDFAAFADALNGVAKLRELILQLAVQGKLVPQDTNDEPAAVLLAKIKAEKAQMIEEKKVKRSEPLSPIDADDVPFDLPQGWEWGRFPELGEFDRGKSKHRPRNDPKLYTDGHYKLVQTGDVARANGVIQTHTGLYNDVGLSQSRMWPKGTMCITIAANIADSGILGFDACFPDSVVGFIPSAEVDDAKYFEYFMRTAQNRLLDYAPSTAQKNINLGILETVLIPLPPLNEIRRIVAKVDQLMALCDELEARQQRQQSARVRLNNAALDRLLTARTPKEFADHWQRLCDNFDLLYDTPATVAALRHCILQFAVQGKLVPQDPRDEPASVLLAKIKAEKERLIQEKKIKKSETLPPIEADEVPFDLPQGWELVRLNEICLGIEAGWSPKCDPVPVSDGEWGVLKISAVSWGRFNADENKRLLPGQQPKPEFEVGRGDFLMSRANTSELVGRSVIVEKDVRRLMMSDKVLRARFATDVELRFVNLINNSPHAKSYYAAVATGTSDSMKNITRDQIKNLPFPLPPLAEQHRIVAKVDHLMALCDKLEAKLRQAQSHSAKLMTATVQHLATA